MARLTEEMVTARTRASDLSLIKKLNCWGGELQDISLLRRMSNVEVLSLSVNKISTLADVQYCKHLKELYVRKNDIKHINEICYLKDLHNLKALWLGENPCSLNDPLYRMTVIKNLPGLEKLDDIRIEPEERQDAMKKGRDLIHPEDYDYSANSSPESSPSRNVRSPPVSSRCSEPDYEELTGSRKSYSPDYEQQQSHQQSYVSPAENRYSQSNDRFDNRSSYQNPRRSNEVIYDQNSYDNGVNVCNVNSEKHSTLQTSNYTPRYTDSYTNNKKENSIDSRTSTYTTNHQDSEVEYRQESKDGYCICPTHQCDRPSQMNISRSRESRRGSSSEGSGRLSPQKGHLDDDAYLHHNERNYRHYEADNRVEAERHPRPPSYPNRRPVTRNSNLLSAVLCLIKELDYQSLEVVGIAVRCRMDEFDD